MARTPSTKILKLGTPAPAFSLPDVVSGDTVSLDTFAGKKALLVMFICRHCPYVVHVKEELARIGRDYEQRELGIVAISSNDAAAYPDDAPDRLAAMARELGFSFPFCYDETQQVAKAYTAACTPDFFLFDADRRLAYSGQLDGSRPGNELPVDGRDLRAAIDAVLASSPVPGEQLPSLGCNIKWKPGNEPQQAALSPLHRQRGLERARYSSCQRDCSCGRGFLRWRCFRAIRFRALSNVSRSTRAPMSVE